MTIIELVKIINLMKLARSKHLWDGTTLPISERAKSVYICHAIGLANDTLQYDLSVVIKAQQLIMQCLETEDYDYQCFDMWLRAANPGIIFSWDEIQALRRKWLGQVIRHLQRIVYEARKVS